VEDLMGTNPKPEIVSTTGNAIKEEALRKFEASFLGEVIHPSEGRYQRSRLLWNEDDRSATPWNDRALRYNGGRYTLGRVRAYQ
jgi:hypothetical protein